MKPTEKIFVSLGTWACLLFIFTNPFNWTNDDGGKATVSPLGWVLFAILSYLLLRIAIVSYKEIINVKPRQTVVRHSRSHYNTKQGT